MGKDTGAKVAVVVTAEMVTEMIAAALKGYAAQEALQVLVTGKELDGKLDGYLPKQAGEQYLTIAGAQEMLGGLFEEFLASAATMSAADLSAAATAKPAVNPLWLEGLLFRDAKLDREEIEGRPKMISTPIKRPLRVGDVLDYRIDQDNETVTLVTTDGQKYTVDL